MADAHHHDHHPDHRHPGHDHQAAVIAQAEAAVASPSLLALSAGIRIATAAVLCAVLWASAFWAMG